MRSGSAAGAPAGGKGAATARGASSAAGFRRTTDGGRRGAVSGGIPGWIPGRIPGWRWFGPSPAARVGPALLFPVLVFAAIAGVPVPAGASGEGEVPPQAAAEVPGAAEDAFHHDAHFHTTNYIQSEIALPAFLEIMGDRVGRAALMGIPLQQKWDAFISGERAPDYYLRSDAALYYYSFVDAMTAEAWRALPPADRARFDPMIVGFNPTDMYATEHLRRVLRLYPGVFSGIGEFSIHKEMVTAKTAGHAASLRNPAVGRILDFAAEVGLVVSLHNDVDVILPRAGEPPTYFDDFAALLRAHPGAPVLWAHAGIGRFVEPTPGYAGLIESLLVDESLSHLYFDLSWDLVVEQLIADEASLAAWVRLLNEWPTRFLFGSDAVIPTDREGYLSTFRAFAPVWERLEPEASRLIRFGNYERLFDEARRRVRAWEAAQGASP